MKNLKSKVTILVFLMVGAAGIVYYANPAKAADDEQDSLGSVMAVQEKPADKTKILTLFKEQDKKLSRELRQIKREIALLRQEQQKPGLQEIIGGIGYILGIFGIIFFYKSRQQNK